jgi:hypothetical protein
MQEPLTPRSSRKPFPVPTRTRDRGRISRCSAHLVHLARLTHARGHPVLVSLNLHAMRTSPSATRHHMHRRRRAMFLTPRPSARYATDLMRCPCSLRVPRVPRVPRGPGAVTRAVLRRLRIADLTSRLTRPSATFDLLQVAAPICEMGWMELSIDVLAGYIRSSIENWDFGVSFAAFRWMVTLRC